MSTTQKYKVYREEKEIRADETAFKASKAESPKVSSHATWFTDIVLLLVDFS